ncbi:MAG TPA: hypothetical protein VE871_02730 [Longimicrobium sp.]|nr:hypothetical protein [Longimicrobium sp.]
MRNLKLDMDELVVESFSVVEDEKKQRGTVIARHSHIPDLCGGYTYDPNNLMCYSYAVECQPSQVPTNCEPSQPTAYVCDSCRDSRTAC